MVNVIRRKRTAPTIDLNKNLEWHDNCFPYGKYEHIGDVEFTLRFSQYGNTDYFDFYYVVKKALSVAVDDYNRGRKDGCVIVEVITGGILKSIAKEKE